MAVKIVKKNIELPQWVVDEITEKAKETGNKFKPYVEWRLTRMAASEKARKETPLKPKK